MSGLLHRSHVNKVQHEKADLVQFVVQPIQLARISQVAANQVCQLLSLPFSAIPVLPQLQSIMLNVQLDIANTVAKFLSVRSLYCHSCSQHRYMYYHTLQRLWLDSFANYHSCSRHCYMYYQTSKTLRQDLFLCFSHTATAVITARCIIDTVIIVLQYKLAMLEVIAVTVETYDQIATTHFGNAVQHAILVDYPLINMKLYSPGCVC